MHSPRDSDALEGTSDSLLFGIPPNRLAPRCRFDHLRNSQRLLLFCSRLDDLFQWVHPGWV